MNDEQEAKSGSLDLGAMFNDIKDQYAQAEDDERGLRRELESLLMHKHILLGQLQLLQRQASLLSSGPDQAMAMDVPVGQ